MNTLNPSNGFLKFNCLHCGQRMECAPRLAGRQFLCLTCQHRIVIPPPAGCSPVQRTLLGARRWDWFVPLPDIEIPTRNCTAASANVLARAA